MALTWAPAAESALGVIAAHPIRCQCLFYLTEREGSASEIAADLNERTNLVSKHVQKLEEIGAIELVSSEIVRGAEKKTYRAVEFAVSWTEEHEVMPVELRRKITISILRFVLADFGAAVAGGTFDSRPDRSLIRYPDVVDDQGFREISRLHDEVFLRTKDIVAEAANRIAGDPGSAIPFTTTTMLYERVARQKRS